MPGRHSEIATHTQKRVNRSTTLRAVPAHSTRVLAVSLSADGKPPSEFRLFVAGWNETENGRFLFDAAAAAATLAAYNAWGVDLAIDLEHQMLAEEPSPDPTAKDARGWCQLELRPDGSLWAVNVTWTPDGSARLTQKRQRYVSPAFGYDKDTGRITKILNVAITAMPATHDTPALVAARARMPRDFRTLALGPSFTDVQLALSAALTKRFPPDPDPCSMNGPWIQDVFDDKVIFELQGKLYELDYTYDGTNAVLGATPTLVVRSYTPAPAANAAPSQTVPAPAAPAVATNRARPKKQPTAKLAVAGDNDMDPKLIAEALDALIAGDAAKCQEILKGIVAGAAGASTDEAPPSSSMGGPPSSSMTAAGAAPGAGAPGTPPPPPKPEKKDEVAAASALLMRLTGATTFVGAVEQVSTFRKSHITLEQETQRLAADRATLEAAARRKGCVELVTLADRAPANVWADAHEKNPSKPKAYLAAMPIADFQEYVKDAIATKRGKAAPIAPVQRLSASGGANEPIEGVAGAMAFETPHGIVTLSARQLDECAKAGAKPEVYASNIAIHRNAKAQANPTE